MTKVHKRFTCFLVALGTLALGFAMGSAESFPSYAGAITGLYTMYLGGQSATDYVKAKNGTVQ